MPIAIRPKLRNWITLLAAAAVLLAACSPTSGTPTSPPDTSPTQAGTDPTAASPTSASTEPVTLRFLQWAQQPNEDIHRKLIDQFMAENPHITVEIETIPFNEFFANITAQAAAGNLADVVAADIPEVQHLAFNGVITPLTPDVYSQEELEDFIPTMVDEGTYNGELYAVAVRSSAVSLFYNADYMAEAGIEPPTTLAEGWTMEQARDVWLQLTQRASPDAPPEVWGVAGRNFGPIGLGSYHGIGMVRSAGEPGSPTYEGISPDGTTVDGYLNTPEAIAAMQFLQDLHQVDKVAPLDTVEEGFGTGQLATVEFPEALIANLQNNYPDLNWGVTPLPYFETGFTHIGSFAYVLSRDTENPAEAGMLIKYLASTDSALEWSNVGKQLPVRKSVYEQITDYNELPRSLFYQEMLEWGQPRPQTPGFREYSEVVTTGLRDIMLGASVEDTVAQMVADIDAALAAYR